MSDERYKKLLGIEPSDEIPTYYELFAIASDERDTDVIDKAYKTQIRRLQEIRTSKDKGFIEFLKEELRKGKRVLTTADKRKAYDESLLEDVLASFKAFVGSLMVMGHINKSLYDTMVGRGVSDGLSKTQAEEAIAELAKEHGATLETGDDDPLPPEEPEFDNSRGGGSSGQHNSPRRGGGETVLKAPPPERRAAPPPPRRPISSGEYARSPSGDDHARGRDRLSSSSENARAPREKAAAPRRRGPWYRGVGEAPPPWGRRVGSERARPKRSPAKAAKSSGPRSKALEEAIRVFNLGAGLAKAAGEVHGKLRLYFPPANGRASATKAINGVTYEKVLDTEQSTLRDSLKKFQASRDKIERLDGSEADLVRVRSAQSIAVLKGRLEEIRQLKMRLMGGLQQYEELRLWQEYIGSPLSARATRTIDD